MGCVASISSPATSIALPNGAAQALPFENDSFNDARRSPDTSERADDPFTQPAGKYTPRNEGNRGSVPAGALLSMAMEAPEDKQSLVPEGNHDAVPRRGRAQSRSGMDPFDHNDHSKGMPDLAYSIRARGQEQRSKEPDDSTASKTGPMTTNAAALSRNVIVNRPSIQYLNGSNVNTEFQDHLGKSHAFVPMQPGGASFVPMQVAPVALPVGAHMHQLAPMGGHPHGPYHLTPLDQVAPMPGGQSFRDFGFPGAGPAGRGRGRGLPSVVVGPNATLMAGGFRGQPLPVGAPGMLGGGGRGPGSGMMGRGRGQPLQIMIPGGGETLRGGSSRLPTEFSAPSHRSPERLPVAAMIQPTSDTKNSDDDEDDDNDDLVDDGEEVEDWGLEEDESDRPQLAASSPSKIAEAPEGAQHGPTRTPPMISPQPKASEPSRPTKKFRPGIEITDDAIQQVDSDSDDDDDDSDDDASGDGDGELSDWLDTSPSPQKLIQKSSGSTISPAKFSGRQEILSSHQAGASTPLGGSPTKSGLVPASPSPTHRPGFGAHGSSNSPHPHLSSQQASTRQLAGFGGAGNISPTRPAGPPPNGGSPVKNPSYRSNIVTSGLPAVMPLSAVGSPMTGPTDTNGAAIRDTKVVKKKKAELPQVNLPHPVPKFGDWLNSRTMINNYIILETLGAGSYAEVKLCKEKVTGKLFAMKFINRDVMKKDKLGKQSKLDDIKREIAIMKKLNHPNVLRLYEVMDDPSMNKLFLVLEYMKHGDLMGHQKKKLPNGATENLHDRDLHCVLLQVILGLAYLHEQKIVHGDIKPQNLLVGDKDVVKIADFGISQSLYGSKQKLSDTAGTPAFMSPEMCSGQEYSGQLADIWAVGATVFMLKFGNPPFVAKSAMQMFEKIQNDPLVFPGPIDPLLEDLLRGMLTKNPIKRMTLLQIMTHPWVTKEEHPSHFVLKDKTPQITVTNEEIDNAIDESDKFAIIVNIRVQMMKRLQKARHEILTQRQSAGTEDSTAHAHKMLVADVAALAAADTLTSPSSAGAHAPKTSSRSSGKTKSNKVFVDAAQGCSRSHHTDEKDHKMLSSEEIHYRSQLFSRKKASGVAASNGASSAALPKTMEHDEHRFRDLVAASSSSAAVGEGDESDAEDEEALTDDDDDETAVSQSPQLLDELLLTTLSMPPLTKAAQPQASSHYDHKPSSPATKAVPTDSSSLPSLQTHSSSEKIDSQWFYAQNHGLRISVGVASLQGRRNTQEDRWTVLPSVDAALSSRWALSLFAGLYDGHGGEDCANILQDQLHAWLFRAPDEHFLSADRLQQCFLEFDTFLCDYLFHKGDLSGSTATCLLVDHTKSNPALAQWKLLVGHVGDCRLVLARRNGETVDVTNDHRLTLQAERERVLQLGGRVVNNRVNGVMAITRAFGDLEFKGLMGKRNSSSMALIPEAVQPSPFQGDDERTPALLTAQPDIHFLSIDGSQDEFLLLACDGLWDVMTSEEATEILRDRFGFHGNLQLAAKELAQEGIRRYSNDNISVVVLHFPTPTLT